MRVLAVAFGFFLGIAGVYTLLTLDRPREWSRRVRNIDRETIKRGLTDPERLKELPPVWVASLLGLLFLGASLIPIAGLRYLIVACSLLVPVLYIAASEPLPDNLVLMVVLVVGTVYGLLVVTDVAPGTLLMPIGLLFAAIALAHLLLSSPSSHESTDPQRTFHYQCLRCEHAFESETSRMTDARCPQCESPRVVSVPRNP